MKKLTVEETKDYSNRVRQYLIDNKWSRAGQACFNVLYEMKPELADHYRSTNVDPFYNNARIADFFSCVISEEALGFVPLYWVYTV